MWPCRADAAARTRLLTTVHNTLLCRRRPRAIQEEAAQRGCTVAGATEIAWLGMTCLLILRLSLP
eukprot:6171923-Pleurochrysis_carterae.AAC.3